MKPIFLYSSSFPPKEGGVAKAGMVTGDRPMPLAFIKAVEYNDKAT